MSSNRSLETKIRPALMWHGGKSNLARRILRLVTDHETYLEPFAGGANVLLNKYRAPREILCDLNTELIFFYQYLVKNTDLFIARLKEIPYSREAFLRAKANKSQDPLERALKFFVVNNQSLGAKGQGFSNIKDDKKQTGWSTYQYDLSTTAARLRGVEIRCQSAFDTIEEFSHDPSVLLYADPPYYPATRVSPDVYTHELSSFEHLILLKKLKEFSGQVILSGYANPVYDEELSSWKRETIHIKNNSSLAPVKPTMSEILWTKPYFPF